MNQSQVSDRLWKAIASNYESGDYKGAILDAMQVITDVLREKSAVDGDGGALVGQALGGENPKIRLNALSTQTEKDFQRGFENMLRGMYLAIRNPRTHEARNDERKTADAILIFINYVLSVLITSSESFTMEGFLTRVMDKDWVDKRRYAELVVSEIPPLHLLDALKTIFENRRTFQITQRRSLLNELFSKLSDHQITSYLAMVSAELKSAGDDTTIRTALQMILPTHWPRIEEVARLRMEHKLINLIVGGEILATGKVINPLGSFAARFLKYFDSRQRAANLLATKLEDVDGDDRHYVAKYFLWVLPSLDESEAFAERCCKAIEVAIRMPDEHVKAELITDISLLPEAWVSRLVVAMADLTDKDNPAVILKDGAPFLTASARDETFDDDIPF